MASFTTEQSLKDTYGDSEVSGLMMEAPGTESNNRFEKAASAAQADIEDYLRTGGYTVPVLYTPYGEVVPPNGPPALHANLQAISDCFTAWYLAQSTDLSKQQYIDCRAAGLTWLQNIANGSILLDTNVTTGAHTISRPQVFVRSQRPEYLLFRRRFRGWPYF